MKHITIIYLAITGGVLVVEIICGVVQYAAGMYIQSNLSKPYPDKTEHLPKPNDFSGPEFFPYYSLLKKPE